MKPAIGIEVPGEQLHVVIAFNKNEIRVNEMFQGAVPIVEIRRDHHLAALVLNHESIGRIQRIVRHLKSLKAEVSYPEAAVGECFQSERTQTAPVEMLLFELRQAVLMDSNLDTEAVKNSQRVMAYVVGVRMRNNRSIDIKLIAQVLCEHLSGSFHRTETTVNQYPGAVGPNKQTVTAATAAQALEA